MFHSHSYAIGDHVVLTRELSNKEGTFDAGHEFEIIDLYERHGVPLYDLRDSGLRLLGGASADDFTYADASQ
jgi:hypothetical protein